MNISSHFPRCRQSGYGLLVVMCFMVVLLLVFASLMKWSSSNSQITYRNNLFNTSENAAEASTENIMSYMMRDFTYGNLGTAASYNTNFPPTNGWPVYYRFSATNGDPAAAASVAASVFIGQVSTSATNLSSQFAGLYGFEMPCTIACTATPLGRGVTNFSATICQNVQFTVIPLFQFAIFYNMDLEINPGDKMNINGHVHSNGTIWASGNSSSQLLTFSNYVDAASGVKLQSSTNDPDHNPARTGNVVFAITNSSNPLSNGQVLSLPVGAASANNNPTNVLAILYPPPSTNAPGTSAAYIGPATNYLENEVDLIITNAPHGTNGTFGTNLVVYYQNALNSPNYLLRVLPDVPVVTLFTNGTVKTTNFNFLYYSFATNVSFYDYRELKTVQAVQINVAALDTWLTNTIYVGGTNKTIINNSKTGTNVFALIGTNSVYLYGTNITSAIVSNPLTLDGQQYNTLKTSGSTEISSTYGVNSIYVINSAAFNTSQMPGVRMINGQRLPPSGLTIATPDPIYVLGNYNITTNGIQTSTTLGNTVNTYPAALMGDALTVLSTNWQDSYPAGASNVGNTRTVSAANTTVNAATLEGIVTSTNNGSGSTTMTANNHYSGGVENFIRLQESWSTSTTNTYNGSIVVMFPSQIATNGWSVSGSYYNPPSRAWGFDLNFNNANLLPPLTPKIKATIRSTWSAW